jgi:formylmethanofuran dehydrogenase subunit E
MIYEIRLSVLSDKDADRVAEIVGRALCDADHVEEPEVHEVTQVPDVDEGEVQCDACEEVLLEKDAITRSSGTTYCPACHTFPPRGGSR